MLLRPGQIYTTTAPLLASDSLKELEVKLGTALPATLDEPPPWPDGWEKTSKRGKIAKRIDNWAYKQGKALAYGDIERIGDLCSNIVIPAGIGVEIGSEVDWNPGDFADGESCFFKSRRQALPFLHTLGARVAKFYDLRGAKLGRCLVVDEDASEWPVAFNFYGIDRQAAATILADMTAAHESRPRSDVFFRWMPLEIANDARDPVWINNSHGYLIGVGDAEAEDEARQGICSRNKIPDILTGWDKLLCEGCYRRLGRPDDSYDETRSLVCYDCYEKLKSSKERRWTIVRLFPVALAGGEPAKPESIPIGPGQYSRTYNWINDTLRPLDLTVNGVGHTALMPAGGAIGARPRVGSRTIGAIAQAFAAYDEMYHLADRRHWEGGHYYEGCLRGWESDSPEGGARMTEIRRGGLITLEDYLRWAAWDRRLNR